MNYHLALVTGATSGIGKAISELLATKGIDLIISGRDLSQLELLKNHLSQYVKVTIIQADLSEHSERQNLIKIIHSSAPDLVINNAGFGLYGDALTYSTDEQAKILRVNSQAVLEITLEAARTLKTKGMKGVVFNVSSVAGFQAFPTMAVYAASKAFVNSFSQALDFEVKEEGIRILTICPGMVETPFQAKAGSVLIETPSPKMTASFVAEKIWTQIQQLKPLTIIDWKYRVLTLLAFFIPKKWVAAIERQTIIKRIFPRTFIKIET